VFSGHGLMWSSMYGPNQPKVKRRVDWRRIGALFAPYWPAQATVLACILAASLLGMVPIYVTAHIIDVTIPRHDLHGLFLAVGLTLVSALAAAIIGVLQGYLNSVVGEGIMRDIRTSLVTHLRLFLRRNQDRRDHEPG